MSAVAPARTKAKAALRRVRIIMVFTTCTMILTCCFIPHTRSTSICVIILTCVSLGWHSGVVVQGKQSATRQGDAGVYKTLCA